MSDLITTTQETMARSYNGISFSPEKRGKGDFIYYNAILLEDLELLGERYGKDHYIKKFNEMLSNVVASRSNLNSSMISGPANFPFRSNEKKSRWYDNHVEKFLHFRERAINKSNAKRTLSPEAEIDEAMKRIDYLEANKLLAKEFVKIKDTDKRLELLKENFPHLKEDSFNFEQMLKYGCGVYNATAKIRETKKKIIAMKSRIENKNWNHTFEGGSMYIDNDRVIIEHDEKPEREVIQQIKSSGFRWSPKVGNWCRKHTGNARWDAENLLKQWKEDTI